MIYKVKQFPIFSRYLASILLEVGLAEGEYAKILNTVGEFLVEDYCRCGDEECNTLFMRSDSLLGRDGAYCFSFNVGHIIINFMTDGRFHVESLQSLRTKDHFRFPFREEIKDVFSGKVLDYDGDDAQTVVDEFMGGLERKEVKRIVV